MKRVLGLGNALVDLLFQMDNDNLLNDFGLPKGSMTLIDEKESDKLERFIENKKTSMVSGGSAANTIHGIARLGVSCGYIGKINDDRFGNFFEQDLTSAGINTNLIRGKAKSGRAYTFISPDTERTFATYLGAAIELTDKEITKEAFGGYDIFHIEGYLIYNHALIEKALKTAKECNLFVSLDMASYNVVADNLDFLKKIIPQYVDLVFANEEEAKAYTAKSPENALNEIAEQVKIGVVKVGKNGSLIKSNGKIYKVGVVETNPVDTTGAGDQYAAGFIYGLNLNLSPDKCGELGALLASKVIENYGARIYDKDWASIIEKAGAIAD